MTLSHSVLETTDRGLTDWTLRFLISKGSTFLGIGVIGNNLGILLWIILPTEWAGEGTMAGRRKGNAPYPACAGWTVRKLWAEIGRMIVTPNNAKKATLVRLLVQDTARLTGNVCRATRGRRVAAQRDGQAGEPLLASASDNRPAPQMRDEDDSDKVAYLQRTVDTLQSSFAELSRIVTESLREKHSKSTLSGTEGAKFSASDDRQQRNPSIPLATSGGVHYVTGAHGPSRESPHVGRKHPSSSQTDQCWRPWSTCQLVAVRQLFRLYHHSIKHCRVGVFLLTTLNMLKSCLIKSNWRSGRARMSIWPPCWYRVLFRSMSSAIVKCTCQTVSPCL